MVRKDPIVEEVHAVREAIAKASDDDIERIVAAARDRQAAAGTKVVRLPPRRIKAEKNVR